MTDTSQYPPAQIPARELPIPTSVSAPAQAILAMPSPELPSWPDDLSDKAAVAATIAQRDAPALDAPEVLAASCFGTAPTEVPTQAEHLRFGDLSVYAATPEGVTADDPRVYLVIHGAWITGGGELSRSGARMTAGSLGVRTWAIDYRMPPYHPFPTPLDDCVAAYRTLLETHRPEDIAVGGTSGGGNLTLAMLLRARDEGLPMPAAAVVNTPYADMTHSGDSMQTNHHIDVGYGDRDLEIVRALYLEGHDPLDPYVSPVYGDYEKGFPPTILNTGTRDFLLSDTVRMHRRLRAAGVEAELHVWEAAPHFMFLGFAPEDHERNAEIRRFLDKHWGSPS